MPESMVSGGDLLRSGAAGGVLLAALTADLFLLARVWRPFAGGVRVWAARLARPFGTLEIAAATGCALAVALPAALSSARPPPAAPPPVPTAASVLFPAAALYAVWIGAAAFCAGLRGDRARGAFFSSARAARPLVTGTGLGLAMVAPVLLLSGLAFTACERLGLDPAPQEVFALLRDPSVAPPTRAAVIAVAVCGAPVAEEFLFRGLLFPALLAHSGSFGRALLLQGLLFGVIHSHLATFPPLGAAGICFALGYAATGSLLTPIAMHMVFNACSILLFLAGG